MICLHQGPAQQFHGIYIKEIIAGGAAEEDGRLQPGDQILFVDTISLVDVTQEQYAIHHLPFECFLSTML